MPAKRDMDATTGNKLLRLFLRLMLDGRKHYLNELALWLNCSSQTIIRLAGEIGAVMGPSLQTGKDKHRRWYSLVPRQGCRQLAMGFEEMRCLLLCRQRAKSLLSDDPGIIGMPWPAPRAFQIHFAAGHAADYVRERIWADAQRIEELPDGGIILHIITRNQPELAAWVREFGDAAFLMEDKGNAYP